MDAVHTLPANFTLHPQIHTHVIFRYYENFYASVMEENKGGTKLYSPMRTNVLTIQSIGLFCTRLFTFTSFTLRIRQQISPKYWQLSSSQHVSHPRQIVSTVI